MAPRSPEVQKDEPGSIRLLVSGKEILGALVHRREEWDIGKATLPLELLHQQTPLEGNQTQRIRSHPRRGADILRALGG